MTSTGGKTGVAVVCDAPCDARGPALVYAAWLLLTYEAKVSLLKAVATSLALASGSQD